MALATRVGFGGRIKGLKTSQIGEVLGCCPYDEVIYRGNMVVTTRESNKPALLR